MISPSACAVGRAWPCLESKLRKNLPSPQAPNTTLGIPLPPSTTRTMNSAFPFTPNPVGFMGSKTGSMPHLNPLEGGEIFLTGFGTCDVRNALNLEVTGSSSIISMIALRLDTKGSPGSLRVGMVILRPSALTGPVKLGNIVRLFGNKENVCCEPNGNGGGEGGPGHCSGENQARRLDANSLRRSHTRLSELQVRQKHQRHRQFRDFEQLRIGLRSDDAVRCQAVHSLELHDAGVCVRPENAVHLQGLAAADMKIQNVLHRANVWTVHSLTQQTTHADSSRADFCCEIYLFLLIERVAGGCFGSFGRGESEYGSS